jgi:hypothetical protein
VVDFYDAAGVRHRYFRATKKEARKLEDQLLAEKWRQQREGLPLAELRGVTVAEYGERWLRESASRLKARTLRSYTGLFRFHIAPVFGQMKVAQLHRSHVKRLLVEKHEQGLSKDTIRLIRATISAMYAAAIDDGIAVVKPGGAAAKGQGAGTLAQSRYPSAFRGGVGCLPDHGPKGRSGLLPVLSAAGARRTSARRSQGA